MYTARTRGKRFCRGVNALADAVKVTLGPAGRNVVLEKSFGCPDDHQGRRHRRQGDRAGGSVREHGRARWSAKSPARPSDVAGDGTTTATVLAQAIFREGAKNVVAGANPMELKRGIDKAVEAIVAELKTFSKPVERAEDRPGRHDLGQQRLDHRQDHRRSDGEGRQGRRHHGRRGQDARDRPRGRRGHAVRQAATSRPYFVTDPERMEVVLDDARHPDPREEDQLDEATCSRCSSRWRGSAARC